jgi:ketosteroid isomerase-like protein
MIEVIESLYRALEAKDVDAISACYHPEAHFRDEVFDLRGRLVPAMWHMLCEGGKDMRITWGNLHAEGDRGRAHWDATYTFSRTGRKVRNSIDSEFRFRDGRIFGQRDRFPFWRWSRMALGAPGYLLGWTPMLRGAIRKTAAANLEGFLERHPGYRNP